MAPAVESVTRAYGLSKRESQIVSLLCEGNAFARIGELMGLSTSTVQTHAKSIYRKLDVHSKQELIDLVHASQPGTP